MNFWPFSKKPDELPVVEEDIEENTGTLTINAMTYDEEHERIRVEMDWDEAFVNYLKRHGYTGTTDEAIVQKYVASLYRNVMDDMAAGGKTYE